MNLKLIFKNLWYSKSYSIINIIGLSFGLATFILGVIYINHQLSFDKSFSEFDSVYRIETFNKEDDSRHLQISAELYDLIKNNTPEIERITRFSKALLFHPLIKTENKSLYIEQFYFADSSFFKVFDFPFIFGNADVALKNPNGIVLSKSTAEKLFQDKNPVGKIITIGKEDDFEPLTITGVYDNDRFLTHLSMEAIRPIESSPNKSTYAYTYIKVNKVAKISSLAKKMTADLGTISQKASRAGNSTKKNINTRTLELRAIADIYLGSHTNEEISGSGNRTGLWLIACLAFFILIGSLINFVNLNIAEFPSKAKQIAIRKVLGATRFKIMYHLYFDILIKCLFSLLIAFILLLILIPQFNNIINFKLDLLSKNNLKIWMQIIIIILGMVLLIGIYPLIITSSLKVNPILKGTTFKSLLGKRIQNVLLVFQFTISCIFIIGIFVLYKQLDFLRNQDLGFNSDKIMVVSPAKIQSLFQYPLIKNELSNISGIENISYASATGMPNEQTTMHLTYNGIDFTPQYIRVDTGYFNLMGASIIQGRNFGMFTDSLNSIVINESLANLMGINNLDHSPSLKVFNQKARIIGIVKDINFYGFENKVPPMAFTPMNLTLTPFILIKFRPDKLSSIIESLKTKWATIEPGYPIQISFLDDTFQKSFDKYETINQVFNYFSVGALIIALIGLFTVTTLITSKRAKEIAIRKVLGANSVGILKLLNKDFLKLILLANILSWPIAYFLSDLWLNNFSFRTQLNVSPFLFASLLTIMLTILIVTLQSLKISFSNPTIKLKEL